MTLSDYWQALRKRWPLILVLAVIGGIGGYAVAQLQPDVYRTQASVVVIPARGDSTSELVQGSSYVQGLVQTYTVVATSPAVLDPVIEDLDLEVSARSLATQITVDSPLNTTVLNVAVIGGDPALIVKIADAVARELAVAVEDLAPQTAAAASAVRVASISSAPEPDAPIAPNARLFAAVGALLGLMIGAAFALLRRLLATRIVSRSDISEVTDLPMLGEVYIAAAGATLPSTVRDAGTSLVAESVRGVAAALRFANVDDDTKVMLVTSADASEGKSSVSLALAQIIAEQGQSVLLIDADLRRGSVAELTGLEGAVGLTTVLVGDATEDEAIHSWGSPNLSVLARGATPPNPGQLLASEHLKQLIAKARLHFDVIIIDSPPVLAVSDPLWLAPIADGIVIVTRFRRTKRDALARTIAELEPARTRILGIVLNGTKQSNTNVYYAQKAPEKPRWRLRG